FSPAETRAFFALSGADALPFALSERLEARSEGWVAGLRLVALALGGSPAPLAIERLLATFAGTHEHIFSYFIAEVLHTQPAPLQEFLLCTSALGRLTGSLCDHVTGRADSELVLERLARANMFLLPLDADRQWYRYHALFAEALQHEARRRYGDEWLRATAHVASHWYEQHGMLNEAIEAALAAHDEERAAGLIERIVAPNIVGNEYHTLRRWFDQLPAPVLRAHPSLGLTYALALLFTSDRRDPAAMALIEAPLQIAEQHWRAANQVHRLGEVLAFRAWVAWLQGHQSETCAAEACAAAGEAMALLPAGATQWRAMCLGVLGANELHRGSLHAARQALSESCAIWQGAGNTYGVLATSLQLGALYAQQGELHQADQLYRQVRHEAEQAPINRQQAELRSAWAQLGTGALALEWNDLQAAETCAAQVVAASERANHDELRMRGTLLLARVKHARGEMPEAARLLRALVAQTPLQPWLPLLREAHSFQARFALAAGDVAAAERMLGALQQGDSIGRLQQERLALIAARLRIAQGSPDIALPLLELWGTQAHDQGRAHSALEILVLQSLAHHARHDLPRAQATLLQALTQAQPEHYQRLFLDEGLPLATLLRSLWADVKATPLA
ncbi:MAG: hypothetical protein H7Y32_02735, partial [Chloroflexales bacterium]|nr:hypothetical protein [Chloroflexales bacterium]